MNAENNGKNVNSKVKDLSLSEIGEEKILMTAERMPIVAVILEKYNLLRPFDNHRIAINCHITKETAVMCIALKNGGADVLLVASSPTSTQDDIAAALVKYHRITVIGHSLMTPTDVSEGIAAIFAFKPDIIMDEGAEALAYLYEHKPDFMSHIIGATVQTSSGISKCHLLEQDHLLKHPVITVNSSQIKSLFDNYFGVGQTSISSITQITNKLIAGETVVVIGYGSVGKGIALRAKGLGAHVIVCEVDPLLALNAYMEGYYVMSIMEAAKIGTIFITATGSVDVLPFEAIRMMKPGAILSNCGSGQNEIDVDSLKKNAISSKMIQPHMVRYDLFNHKYVYLLTDGRVTNIIAAGGNAPELMDLTFSAVLMSVEYLMDEKLEEKVYTLPNSVNRKIARLRLNELDIHLSEKTSRQQEYDNDWHK